MHGLKPNPALDRRSFLYRAIQLAAATTPLLSACGGGSDAADAAAASAADSSGALLPGSFLLVGQVTLPASLSLKGTRIVYPLGKGDVSAAGAFQVPFIDAGIAFSQLRDAAGNLLVFGFLSAEQTTLSTRSTAEALVFRGLGLWAQAPRIRVAALTLLRTEDLAMVEAAVVSAIAAGGPAWLSSAKVGLSSAVNAKVATMIGPPPVGAAARKSVQLQGSIVTPRERVSGLTLECDGIAACTVTNYFRRRSALFHTPFAAKLEAGLEFPVSEYLLRTEVSATDGLSSPLQAIADLFFERKSLYTPVSVSLATPLVPDGSVYTRYKVYGVGPGTSLGTWGDLPQSVRDAGIKLIIRSIVLDFAVPLLASVVIFSQAKDIDKFIKATEASDALKDLVNLLAKAEDLVNLLLVGDFKGCCVATLNYMVTTDSYQIATFAAMAAICEANWGPWVIDKRTGVTVFFEEFIHDAWSAFDKVLDTGEFAFTLFDSAVQALDIGSSRLGESWEVTVTKAKVSLTPLAFFVEKNANFTDITATVQNQGAVEGRVFGYRWKCRSGHLYAGGKYATVIDSTTYNVVGYDALDVNAGTVDKIEVDVVISGFKDEPVGSAKAKVYVTGLTVTPEEKKKLKASESVTLTAATVGMRPLVAGEKVVYKWLLGGTPGTLTATDTETATFKADATKEGLAVVTVEAFLGERRIGRAQSNLTVGNKLIIAGRVFEDHWKDASGCHAGMYIAFPKVQDAKSYDVFVTGMRGPVFGTEYRWSVYVIALGRVGPFPWTDQAGEILGGSPRGTAILGGSNGGGDACIDMPDGRWAAWYQGSTVQVTVTL